MNGTKRIFLFLLVLALVALPFLSIGQETEPNPEEERSDGAYWDGERWDMKETVSPEDKAFYRELAERKLQKVRELRERQRNNPPPPEVKEPKPLPPQPTDPTIFVDEENCIPICTFDAACNRDNIHPNVQHYYEGCLVACTHGFFGANPNRLIPTQYDTEEEGCMLLRFMIRNRER